MRREALARDPLGQLQDVVVLLAGEAFVSRALAEALDAQPFVEEEAEVPSR